MSTRTTRAARAAATLAAMTVALGLAGSTGAIAAPSPTPPRLAAIAGATRQGVVKEGGLSAAWQSTVANAESVQLSGSRVAKSDRGPHL